MTNEELRKENAALRRENATLLSDNIKLAHMVAHRTSRYAIILWFSRLPGARWLVKKGLV